MNWPISIFLSGFHHVRRPFVMKNRWINPQATLTYKISLIFFISMLKNRYFLIPIRIFGQNLILITIHLFEHKWIGFKCWRTSKPNSSFVVRIRKYGEFEYGLHTYNHSNICSVTHTHIPISIGLWQHTSVAVYRLLVHSRQFHGYGGSLERIFDTFYSICVTFSCLNVFYPYFMSVYIGQ